MGSHVLSGDVPTLFEAPRGEPGEGDVALLGVPYEGAKRADRHTLLPPEAPGSEPGSIYFRTGADRAPEAIRRQSVYYSLEHDGAPAAELDGLALAEALRVIECGDHDLDGAERVARQAAAGGAATIALGGDHLVPLPLLRGLQAGNRRRLGLVVFDSHYDLHPAPPLWAGSQWRTAFEEDLVEPGGTVILGLRGVRHSPHELEAARELGVTAIPLRAIDEGGIEAALASVRAVLAGAEAVYVSLDVDVVDPAFCPAQKYPEAGGLTARETLRLLREAGSLAPLAGFDLCCLSPDYDEAGRGALFAARCALELLLALAAAPE